MSFFARRSLISGASLRLATPQLRTLTRTLATLQFPQVTKPAPDFKDVTILKADKTFGKLSLSDLKGKWAVLFFYPLDFTFVCPTEIIDFSERAEDFKQANCEVIGASCDSEYSHLAWVETSRKTGGLGEMKIPIISDMNRELSAKYGVLLNDSFPVRGTFVIDPNGILRHMSFNDPPVGRNVDEVLRLVKAYQFVDKHGEVCPSGWQPGQSTIIPSPIDKVKYFSKK